MGPHGAEALLAYGLMIAFVVIVLGWLCRYVAKDEEKGDDDEAI